MKKVKKAKLDLPESEKVVELSVERQSQVIGGFFTFPFSIGHGCSHRVRCPRLHTKC